MASAFMAIKENNSPYNGLFCLVFLKASSVLSVSVNTCTREEVHTAISSNT